MSILFIYPPTNFQDKNATPISGFSPPLGILYLGAILKNGGHEVYVIDAEAERLSLKQLTQRIKSINPEIIGLTCLTYTVESCKSIISEIKKNIDAYIVIGGPHSTVAPETSFELGADAYVVGEAEMIIKRIITEKPRGVIHANEVRDINVLPFPDRSLVENVKYGKYFGEKAGNMTAILTSRGCKHNCAFCSRPRNLCFRVRSPKNIVQELKEIDSMGFDSVWLADNDFISDPTNVIKISRLIKKEKLKFNFFGSARVGIPSKTLYKSMKNMGVGSLSYGVESLNPTILRWYNKTKFPEKWSNHLRKTLNLCHENGIIFIGNLIFGAPMETIQDMEYSIEFLDKYKADRLQGNILLYLIGSPIWRWAVNIGKIKPNQYIVSAPEAGLTPYSYEELNELCMLCAERRNT